MITAGIICEYNPFHNGHRYHIEQTRKAGATHVVAVMSGAFVQRGDIAITDKWTRARYALMGGADLVIELPCAYAMSTAESFARGAVHILDKLGFVDILSFGSECGRVDLLLEAGNAACNAQSHPSLQESLKQGKSYPAAMQQIITKLYGEEIAAVFASPNNTLGIEYIQAIHEFSSKIKPITIMRKGAAHDTNQLKNGIASASYIRKLVRNNSGGDLSALTPMKLTRENITDISRLETAILYRMRMMSADDIQNIPDVGQGLENRIYKAARTATTLDELLRGIKSKRYTLARLRRIVLCCLLGITKNDLQILPPYARIIGVNERGFELLKTTRGETQFPLMQSLAKLRETSPDSRRFADLEGIAGDIFALSYEKRHECGAEFTTSAVVIK